MIPIAVYFFIYMGSVVLLLYATINMNNPSGKQFTYLSVACLGIGTVSFMSVWDKFDWFMLCFGLFNVFLGLVVSPVLRLRSGRRRVSKSGYF